MVTSVKIESIEDIERYDPKKVNDKQLVDDHRITHAWAATIRQGKKFKYSKEQVRALHDAIVKEMLKRKMKHDTPIRFREYSKPGVREIKRGLYLTPPHGRLIFDGKKKAIVLGRKVNLSGAFILISGKEAFGYVAYGYPKNISLEEFDRLHPFHQVNQSQRRKWWPDRETLFYYPLLRFIGFSEPAPVKVPRRAQLIIPEVNFVVEAQEKKAKDFREIDLKKLGKRELVAFHSLLHDFYHGRIPENATLEDVINSHELVIAEMKRRGIEHPKFGDGLDKEIKELEKIAGDEVRQTLNEKYPERIDLGEFIFLIGSAVEKGFQEINDVDILVKQKGFNRDIQNALTKPFSEDLFPHGLIFDDAGPHGKYYPMYRLVLERIKDPKEMTPDYDLMLPFQGANPSFSQEAVEDLCHRVGYHPLSVEPHIEGLRLTAYKQNGKTTIYWRERMMRMPELEAEFQKAELSEFALEGIYQADGKFYITEPLKWRTTELINMAKDHSQFFLLKDAMKFSDVVVPVKFLYSDTPIELVHNIRELERAGHSAFVLKHRNEAYPAPGSRSKFWLAFGPTSFELVEVMKPFTPLKAISGYHEAEFSKIDELYKFWAKGWYDKGQKIAVEPKFDGIRLVIHKDGDNVKIFTEDKKADRAHILPQLVEEIKTLPHKSFVLDSETVWWKEGRPIPRRDMIAIVTGKQSLGKEDIRMNVFDALFIDGEDMASDAWSVRQNSLKSILPKNTQHLKRVIPIITKNRPELLKAVQRTAAFPRSEGAMLKTTVGDYPTKGLAKTSTWSKFKVIFEATVQVIGKRLKEAGPRAKKAQTYLYYGAIRRGNKLIPIEAEAKRTPGLIEKEERRPTKHRWKVKSGFEKKAGDYDFGTTYATNIDVPIGGHITVAPGVIRSWIGDDGKSHYSWIFPRVQEARPDRKAPDTVEDLSKFIEKLERSVRSSEISLQEGGLEKEKATRQEKALEELEKLGNPYLVEQKPGKKYPFVIQYHVRGIPEDWDEKKILRVLRGEEKTSEKLSLHNDERFETNKDYLVGWTVTTPGNLKKRDKLMNNQERDNIVVLKKAVQPPVWLKVKGRVKPGEVGATAKTAGYFWLVARGTMTYGIQKDDTHEYFINPTFVEKGFDKDRVAGRWQLSLIPRRKEFEKAGRKAVFWQMTRPLEQKPYIETHNKEKEIEKAKKEEIRMIWQGPGVKPEKFDFKK